MLPCKIRAFPWSQSQHLAVSDLPQYRKAETEVAVAAHISLTIDIKREGGIGNGKNLRTNYVTSADPILVVTRQFLRVRR